MNVFINDRAVECPENQTLTHFLEQQKIDISHIAIAINDSVIFRKEWSTTVLTDGCRILMIKATQGG